MLGERSDQRGLWEADRLYLDHVGKDTFYGLLASLRGRLFRDSDFAVFYCADNGRDSVPPSLLATALLHQSHDKVSDAKARADFDIRWKVALGIEVEDRPFAKSTLQVFRAQLILHDKVREVFESSLRLARESGYLKRRSMKVALDTTNILGRGAVRDTYNLLADGTVKLLRALAQVEGISVGKWAKAQGYGQYLASSIKGEATIDWSDKRARAALLAGIVRDADRLLELSRQAQGELPEDSAERQQIVAAAELLGQLLLQDVERTEGGVSLRDGVSRDRMMSVHDPEMRHGHKSSSRRFDGHKAAIVVDTDSQLITAVEVLPGKAPDNSGSLELVEASESNTGVPVQEAMGDAAYGDGYTRQAFADAGRTLIARVPGRPNRSHFPKEDFHIDLSGGHLHLSGGERYPENPALRYSHHSNRPDSPTEGLPVLWSGLRGVPAADPVRGRGTGHRTDGAAAPAGGFIAAGPCPAAERGLWRVPPAPGGSGAPSGAAGPTGNPPGALLRARQDDIPAVPGGHGGQPDLGRRQTRTVGPGQWRPNRPQHRPEYSPLCCRQCYRQFLRSPPRTAVARDSAHAGFTAQISLPNENFPATFLGRNAARRNRSIDAFPYPPVNVVTSGRFPLPSSFPAPSRDHLSRTLARNFAARRNTKT